MQKSLVDAKTLNRLLNNERKEVIEYFSKNMRDILLGFQKIDKFCAINLSEESSEVTSQSFSCINVPTRTERFPTKLSIEVPRGKFPSFLFYKNISENSDSE
jgi:hypothetical protein